MDRRKELEGWKRKEKELTCPGGRGRRNKGMLDGGRKGKMKGGRTRRQRMMG